MNYETITYSNENGISTIGLNRPEKYNAFNTTMNQELLKALNHCAGDSDCRVVVLTGEGKGFCSGQDLTSVMGDDFSFGDYVREQYNPLIKAICEMQKPILCKLNGVAAGAGCSVALACDYIIASETAVLVEAFIGVGLVMDSGSSYFLPRLVGTKKAFELATQSTKLTANQAMELGMVNKVVGAEELDSAALEIATFYANAPTKAIGLIKEMINSSEHKSLDEILEMEAVAQEKAGTSNDFAEGVAAFIEKRKPKFTGS